MPRLFIGWPVPDPMREEISEAIRPLRTALPSASWVRPETYHVTFAFLGEQPEQTVTLIADSLDEALEGVFAERVRVIRPGFFPDKRRCRVGWLEVVPAEPLTEVSGRVENALVRAGMETDKRVFKPHLTVVRTKGKWTPRDAEHFVDRLDALRSKECVFDRVILFGSELTAEGAIHSVLHRVDLVARKD